MRKALFILVIFFTAVGFSQTSEGIQVIEPERFEQEIQKEDIQFIDVRTPKEYEEGHIEGAMNIDFLGDDFLQKFSKLDKEKPVYLYCRSGNRSAKASAKLKAEGFENIIDLKGGYKAWSALQEK